jgi:uncharacterized protein YpuA (DUF1002 family)
MNNFKEIEVEIDERLDIEDNQVFAPKKLAKMNAILEKVGLPNQNKGENLTPLQKELLQTFALNPTDMQMQELKAFLEKMFNKNVEKTTEKDFAHAQ